MLKSNLFKGAHKMAKEIKAEYKEVNYKFQFGLCLSYLGKIEGEIKMVKMTRENNVMLKKVIEILKKLPEVETNSPYGKEVITEATEMFNKGWDSLEDGIVVLTQDNLVAVKKGNKIVKYEMKDFNVNMGKLSGNIDNEIGTIEVADSKKEIFLVQTIITKYYTIRRA